MKQHEAVMQAMRENGGYATLGHLYRTATKIDGSHWGTKTPFASIRRIVQIYEKDFFKIRPGLWALTSERETVLKQLSLDANARPLHSEEFNHSYYQGLLIEIGNLKNYQTFIPRQDKNKQFLKRKLADISTLQEFHPFTYDTLLRRARTVDVSWFNERKLPNSFFEVEHSTDIQNSLLKFRDFEDFRIKFYIVADNARRREFNDKIARTAFAPVRSEVKFLEYETLSDWHTKVSAMAYLERNAGF